MEAAGTGFDKIIEEYAGKDEEHSPLRKQMLENLNREAKVIIPARQNVIADA